MDLVGFFRMAIVVTLAIFCGGLVLTIIVMFVGNAFYILKNYLKREETIVEVKERLGEGKSLRFERTKKFKETLPKAG